VILAVDLILCFKYIKIKLFFFSFYILIFSPLTLEILIYLEDIKWHDLVNVFESVDHLQVIASCSY
jgi:hypothetical protein